MNTPTLHSPIPSPRPNPATPPRPSPTTTATRRDYPARDFGIGYGRSSGYATQRHYASAWNGEPRFRCS